MKVVPLRLTSGQDLCPGSLVRTTAELVVGLLPGAGSSHRPPELQISPQAPD
jgi:hypothetical protein